MLKVCDLISLYFIDILSFIYWPHHMACGGKIPWRRKWQCTPVYLPGKSHGQRSLAGYSAWGRKESDMTGRLHFTGNTGAQSSFTYEGSSQMDGMGWMQGRGPWTALGRALEAWGLDLLKWTRYLDGASDIDLWVFSWVSKGLEVWKEAGGRNSRSKVLAVAAQHS